MTRPPGGMTPPARADGLDLVELAKEICARYRAEYPDEQERYGDAGMAWCRHDNQHILGWAVGARDGLVDLERELGWLARVLAARDFPLDRLARDLEIAADVAPALAEELTEGARFVRALA